jgi:eukaryotic-like serine/threonine-protein kinase
MGGAMVGKTLGHYQITSQLGKGGMGEVYQAKDQKLGRDVAIKVLPEEFAKDADRVARFQREAKLLASLNHPNIAGIHGLEESGGTNFLVLELVEGETLADRIKQGPIPVEEALKLALQIAEALEAAHEKGVIHRDLKPANIKVTADGKVKVLDFGLAKAFGGEKEEVNLSNSPTLSDAATQKGVILGTAAYMSPEQARGESVDKRADIWAFGCVLFEMLTGRGTFEGRTVTDVLASVIKSEPVWNRLPPNLLPRIRLLLERCLEKEAKNRCSSIGDARVDVQKALAEPGGVFVPPVAGVEHRKALRIMPWIAAAVALAATIGGVALWTLRPSELRQVMRFEYELPEGQQLSTDGIPVDVSRDGKQVVYSTSKGLYLRAVDELTARLIVEGEVQQPFFSPDGQWIGFFSVMDQQLKKTAITGGLPVTLCAVKPPLLGASWGSDDTIIYSPNSGSIIMRISANGGIPETVIKAKSGTLAAFPQLLPDGKSVLYGNLQKVMVQSLKSGEAKELFAGVGARYVPTGHIVYLVPKGNNVFGVFGEPFNLERLEVTGGPVPLIEGVSVQAGAFSNTGTLVYIPETAPQTKTGASASARTLVWVDREGHEEAIPAPPNLYRYPKICPDGNRIALTVENKDIWIWDLIHKTLTRLTFEIGGSLTLVWSPDGKRIAYYGTGPEKGGVGIYCKAADGTGQEELLSRTVDRRMFFPYCWTGDGKYLVGAETPDLRKFDIGVFSIEGDHTRKTLLQNAKLQNQPQISRDGKWMAYASDESGKNEIYVRPFPDVDKGRWQVSTSGGDSPLWSPDGRELFYLSGDAVMRASVKTEPKFEIIGTPNNLFRGTFVGSLPDNGTPWDIRPDGKRFLMIKPPTARPKINIVLNWFEELKQRVPVK